MDRDARVTFTWTATSNTEFKVDLQLLRNALQLLKSLTGSKDAEAATFSLKKADIATAQRTIAQVQKIQTLEALASCINSIVAKNAQNACAGNRIAQALPTTALPQAPRPRLALEDTSQFTQTVQGTTNAAIRVTNILPVRTHALIPIIIS